MYTQITKHAQLERSTNELTLNRIAGQSTDSAAVLHARVNERVVVRLVLARYCLQTGSRFQKKKIMKFWKMPNTVGRRLQYPYPKFESDPILLYLLP